MALLYRMGTGNGSGGDLKPFIVNFTCHSGFIGKTVTMEFQGTPHAGETVDNVSGTVASDGTLTLYPMHDGLWKYYATSDLSGYQEGIITLEKWGNYSVEFIDTPDGATVTPTDDVQTWLHCANVWNKSYTTISEVVADTTTLNIVISDNNASDYLVRSTTFATDICSNESAMTYIGLNDYCANKLLADSTWLEAICNAKDSSGKDLFEIVLDVKVPTLHEDSSLVFSSTDYSSNHAKWKAFNGNNVTDSWLPANGDTDAYVGYEFTNPVIINKVVYLLYRGAGLITFTGKTIKVKATNDKSKPISQWQELFTTSEDFSTNIEYPKIINNNTAYKYYAFNQNNGNVGSGWHIQFYGRERA